MADDTKMEEGLGESCPRPPAEPIRPVEGHAPVDPGAKTSPTETCDHMTEEEENKLLAEDDDLDVIDFNTEDIDSDVEKDLCRKETKEDGGSNDDKVAAEKVEKTRKDETDESELAGKTVCLEKTPEKIVPDPDDDDEDIIQLCDDISDTFLDEVSSTSVAAPPKPEISLRVKDEFEKDRILKEPLVKRTIIPEICVSDDEDDKISVGSQESISLQIDHFVEKSAEVLDSAKKSRNEAKAEAHEAANTSAGSERGLNGCHQEDPDVLKLKSDLYQDVDGMDNEAEEKPNDCTKLDLVRVKQEPRSPTDFQSEDIPTIELTSTDEEAELIISQPKTPPKKKKRTKRKSKEKTSAESLEVRVISSEDSFPIVVDSTISIDSRLTRNDSDGSLDDLIRLVDGRMKALRNRTVAIVPEAPGSGKTKTKGHQKSADTMEPPVKRKKKVDPAMIGYRSKRRKSVGRSASKSSVVSVSTATSSLLDEEMIVLSADDVLLADPSAIQGAGAENTEKEEVKENELTEEALLNQRELAEEVMLSQKELAEEVLLNQKELAEEVMLNQKELTEGDPDPKSNNDSKEELMHSLDLKEAIAKELEQEEPLRTEKDEADENQIPLPTTDIALEDMLDSFIDKETNDKHDDLVFHSISPEEKFLMDSLFADCEKQSQQVPSQEHLHSLHTIMDDGKPLVEPSNIVEPISISYTICDGSVQSETVHMELESVTQPAAEVPPDVTKAPRPPNIKIIQNYQKYPFQAKPPKKQLKENNDQPVQGQRRRGRKKREVKDDTDEEYIPASCRKQRRGSKTRKPRTKPPVPKPPAENDPDEPNEEQPIQSNAEEPGLKFDNGDDDDDGTATTSTVCRNMPNLEQDLAMTSSDEGDNTGDVGGAPSKELITTSKTSHSSQEGSASARQQKNGASKKPNGGVQNRKASGAKAKTAAKRGRPFGSKNTKISDFYLSTTATAKVREPHDDSASQQSSVASLKKDVKVAAKPGQKRKRKRLISSSQSEDETASLDNRSATETEPELQLSASSFGSVSEPASEEHDLEKTQVAANKMDSLQIVISPLTEDKIRKINTPQKKPRMLTKASQTEISGLTWSIDLDQIDFQSEYFKKLRILLNNGAQRGSRNEANRQSSQAARDRSFNGVDIPSRSILQRCLGSSSPPRQPVAHPVAVLNSRSSAEELLFQRALNEVELGANTTADRTARQRLEREVNNVRSNFRIPKVRKQASTSPQVVTSSTPHLAEPAFRHDDLGVDPAAATASHPTDHLPPNRSSGSHRPPDGVPVVVQRTISNDYVDDRSQFAGSGNAAARNLQEIRSNIMMQDRFEAPVNRNVENVQNANYMPPSSAENGSLGIGLSNASQDLQQQPAPNPMENRSGLPNRAEMQTVRRTIRNDMTQQPLQQPQLVLPGIPQAIPQPFVPGPQYNPPAQQNAFPMFGGFQPASFGAGSNSFGRGGSTLGYPGLDMMSMFAGDMMGMQPRANPNNFNDFLTMLYNQFQQQQQPPPLRQQPLIQPPVQPTVAPLHNMPMQSAPNQQQPPVFSQMFPQMTRNPMQASSSQPQAEPPRSSEQVESISFIFGCIDFLNGKCIKIPCRYPHVLPSDEEVFQKLSTQSRDAIMMTYRFVVSRDDLFIRYFPVYASVMGRNNMRHQLVGAIPDCEQSKRPIQYYKHIVEGLKASGTNPVQAVQLILEKHTKKSFHQINVLIELILDTGEGIPTFLRTLEEFSHVKDFYYDITSVNRLLEFCVLSPVPISELATLVTKLILKVPAGDEQFVSTTRLLEFIQKAGLDPGLTLNVEDIVKKYGSVAMRP